MDEAYENGMELFCQDGVLLKSASASFIQYLNTSGTLSIVEYLNSNQTRFIEWKPNDITIDSDVQDQEWAVVNTVERRARTLSGSSPPDGPPRRIIRINMKDIKSFRVTRLNQKLSFNDASRKPICTFVFQHGNADCLVAALKGGLLPVAPSRDKNLYIVVEHPDFTRLNKSFAELNLFPEQNSDYVWKFFKNLHNRPYETTMEAFSKLTDIIYRGPDPTMRCLNDAEVEELLSRSLTEGGAQAQDEYEVVSRGDEPPEARAPLPPRPAVHRGSPLTRDQWHGLMDHDGRISDVDGVKMLIFRGGVHESLRRDVWRFLLGGGDAWGATRAERDSLRRELAARYTVMKTQWTTMSPDQEERHGEYRERKSLVEKDVNRTDRTSEFYAGEDNPNLRRLHDVLMTYVMYDFDLGYVQGMSDLASPLLRVMDDEADAFWCFVGFMERVRANFSQDQSAMKEQLAAVHDVLAFVEPQFAAYLRRHDSHNMFFCFRWLLVWFKREFEHERVCRLWEVLWTGLPAPRFHLLVCLAVLQRERVRIEEQRSFSGILKYVNELTHRIPLDETLAAAEALHHQLAAVEQLPAAVRAALGREPPSRHGSESSCDTSSAASDASAGDDSSAAASAATPPAPADSPIERSFQTSLDLSYI